MLYEKCGHGSETDSREQPIPRGRNIKSRGAADLFSRGRWQVRHQLEQPRCVGNGDATFWTLADNIERTEPLHQPDCGWRTILSAESNCRRYNAP